MTQDISAMGPLFGFGMPGQIEFLIIFLVALLLFGAKKLPELARGFGKALGEFKAAQREFQDEIRRAEYSVREETRALSMDDSTAARPRPEQAKQEDLDA